MTVRKVGVVAIITAWAALGLGSAVFFCRFAGGPAPVLHGQSTLPQVGLPTSPEAPTIVMFVHPMCPCTIPAIADLEEIVNQAKQTATIDVVFCEPKDPDLTWVSAIKKESSDFPSEVHTIVDPGGKIAKSFGAQVSSETMVFSKEGNLVFDGGLTPARGQVGDSDGREAIIDYLNTGQLKVSKTPAYGCTLIGGGAS